MKRVTKIEAMKSEEELCINIQGTGFDVFELYTIIGINISKDYGISRDVLARTLTDIPDWMAESIYGKQEKVDFSNVQQVLEHIRDTKESGQ